MASLGLISGRGSGKQPESRRKDKKPGDKRRPAKNDLALLKPFQHVNLVGSGKGRRIQESRKCKLKHNREAWRNREEIQAGILLIAKTSRDAVWGFAARAQEISPTRNGGTTSWEGGVREKGIGTTTGGGAGREREIFTSAEAT